MRTLALTLLSAISTAGLTADLETVKAPYVEVGECWSYRAQRVYYHGWIESYTMCATLVDRAHSLIMATATVSADGREIDLSYTSTWGARTDINGEVARPPAEFFKFPLRIGDQYTVVFTSSIPSQGVASLGAQFSVEVKGWEDVTVPAGTFHALKVQAKGYISSGVGDNAQTRTWWYVPGVNRYVKFQRSSAFPIADWSEELTEYRLNK